VQSRSLWDPRHRDVLDELFGLDERAWVHRAPANTSHGLCPVCDHYYDPEDPKSSPGA
jgi:hypothetical protein